MKIKHSAKEITKSKALALAKIEEFLQADDIEVAFKLQRGYSIGRIN